MKNIYKSEKLYIIIVLICAAFLRFYAIDFGKPFLYHPDEIKLVAQAGRLLEARFMEKSAFFGIQVYPPFYTYLLAIVIAFYVAIGFLFGTFSSLHAVKTAFIFDPFQYHLLSRVFVASLGVLSVYVVYLFGRKFYSKNIGLLSALFLAVNFLFVRNSHFGTVDIPAALFALSSLLFCSMILKEGKTRDYIFSALFMAAAVATKFSLFVLALSFFFAHFARFHVKEWLKKILDKKLWIGILSGSIALLLFCPILWLDFEETWGGLLGTQQFEKVGKIGSGGGFLSYWTGNQAEGFGVFYPNSIPATFGILLTVATIIGLILAIIKKDRMIFLHLSFVLPTYIIFEDMSIKALRHIIPLVPFFMIFAAVFMDWISRIIKIKKLKLVIPLFCLLIAGWNVSAVIKYFNKIKCQDPRTAAYYWIEQNIPKDSCIAVEDFPPPLNDNKDKTDNYFQGYNLVDAGLSVKSIDALKKLKSFFKTEQNCYYLSDSFSRQMFQWKITKLKYPEITKDRHEFFNWLEQNSQLLKIFESKDQKIQPTIKIYKIKSSY